MKITSISVQARDKDRVNVSVDGKYRFSLDIVQLSQLNVRLGNEYSEEELAALELESQYGKLYNRALEYSLMRPHSQRELRDYLYRKTRDTRTKDGGTRPGVSKELTDRVYERLVSKKIVNDEAFARYWIENRRLRQGSSQRKLAAELMAKGVDRQITEKLLGESERDDAREIEKVIAKKRQRYDDDQKFMAYLARQGFSYDDIKAALAPGDQLD